MRVEVPVLPQAGLTEGAALDLRGRSRHGAPDRKIVGGPHFASAPQEDRDAVRASQAHSQARPLTFTRTKRCARRVHPRCHRPEPSEDGQADPDADLEARMKAGKSCLRDYNELLRSFSTKSALSGFRNVRNAW